MRQSMGTSDKWSELYSMADKRKGRRDKSTDDYRFERERSECTFRPNIERLNLKKGAKQRSNEEEKQRDASEQPRQPEPLISRREEEEKAEIFDIKKREKHESSSASSSSSKSSKEGSEPLYFDHQVHGKPIKLALYKKTKPKKVAKKFFKHFKVEGGDEERDALEERLKQAKEAHFEKS